MKTPTIDRPFGRVLAEMRQQGRTRRTDDLRRRCDASLERAEQLVAAFARVEQAVLLIEQRVAELAREISPETVLGHRFYDGRWQVSGRLDEMWIEPDGRLQRARSQVVFLIDAAPGTGRLRIECHVTVRDRDLPVERVELATADGDLPLAGFAERTLLEFAARWLDACRAGASRPSIAA